MYETKVALDDNSIRLSMPLFKVDESKRMVHGFATLDNLDKQDDIVTKAASIQAFEKFRGNIREQHDPKKAVGRVVSFRPDSIYDPETQKTYNGVFVSVYVSKGAEDTWQKVLDQVLTGFSIGGSIKKTENAYDENLDKSIRIVHEYDLSELSLVDNPANQLANVISIEKADNGTITMETPLVKGELDNVFWCQKDGMIILNAEDAVKCAVCEQSMDNIGFVEANDSEKEKTIKTSLDEFKKSMVSHHEQTVKEANEVAEDTIVEEAVAEEVAKSDEAIEESAPEMEAEVEKADEAPEAEAEVEEVEKSEEVAEVAEEVAEVVEKDAAAEVVDELKGQLISSLSTLTDAVKTLNDKIDSISKSVEGVQAEVAEVKGNSESLGKRVDAVEDTTAFRKSGDLGEVVQEQEIRKSDSPWGGRFLNTTDL